MDNLRYLIIPITTCAGVLGFYLGSHYVWLGALTFPLLLILDLMLPKDLAHRQVKPWFVNAILHTQLPLLTLMHLTFAWSVTNGSNDLGSGFQLVGSLLSLIWLNSVPTLPVAHELMHRRHWFPRLAAKFLNTFYADTNRDIAHVMTHHIHLNTPKDSDTPYRGQTIYSFVFQATMGSYEDSIKTEAEVLSRQGFSAWNWRNHLWLHLALQFILPISVAVISTPLAGACTLLSMFLAKLLIEAFNYYQHYGLIRVEGSPVAIHHAWNHLGMIVRPLGAEITNHIHHHIDGHTPFYNLKPEPHAPQMPSLFLCFIAGILPPVWFHYIAKPRLRDWDNRFATKEEQQLAIKANMDAGWPNWISQS